MSSSKATPRPARARRSAASKALFDRLSGVFDNAGIAKRHIVAPQDWYVAPHGWHDRNAVYLEAAESLFVEAATRGHRKAGLTPGPDRRRRHRLDHRHRHPQPRSPRRPAARPARRRPPRAGLRPRLRRRGQRPRDRRRGWPPPSPARNWLFVTVETCSISIRLDSDDPAAVVATALFGDGAAAAVVTSGEHSLARITGSAEKLWPDTLRIMGWDVEDPGLAVVFDRAIPPFIEAASRRRGRRDVRQDGRRPRDDIDRFCCHPGGVKVIDAIETALELNQGELNLEREVLRDYGNMSAPTVLFVLERLLERGLPERVLMTAFGPGFTCAGLLLEAA